MNKKSDEIVQAIAAIHAAHTNALVVLVKTLKEAGVVDPTHYAANIRMTSRPTTLVSGRTFRGCSSTLQN